MTLEKLQRLNLRSIRSAGPRYSPGLDSAAPNVQIAELVAALNGLMVSNDFRAEVREQSKGLNDRAERAAEALDDRGSVNKCVVKILAHLEQLCGSNPGSSSSVLRSIRTLCARANRILDGEYKKLEEQYRKRQDELRKAPPLNTQYHRDAQQDAIERKRSLVTQLDSALGRCNSFCNSSALRLRFGNAALIVGDWGTGKTHLLCDIASRVTSEKKPALLILARDFDPGHNCGSSLAEYAGFGPRFEVLLRKLDQAGRKSGQRALLLIDGLNEADMNAWRRDVCEIVTTVRKFQWVGLVLSCRDPFQAQIFPKTCLGKIVELRHAGFDDATFDAQKSFFSYYGVPLPEVPLLEEEFSRPLTLKILCEAFIALPAKEKAKGFHGLSSGQKGMTFILERFVIERTRGIERLLSLPGKFCWKILKGDNQIADPALAGFASYMAHHAQEWIPLDQAIRILLARPQIANRTAAFQLLRLLEREGIVYRHVHWRSNEDGKPIEVVGLPYQRFTDHIVARHLLSKYLDTRSPTHISSSLEPTRQLGRIFEIRNAMPHFAMASWAEAVIVEFPEFAKNILPPEKRELYFYLPKESRLPTAYFGPFVGGLVWRTPTSICAQTDRLVGTYFWGSNESCRNEIAEALVTVATKPDHPYSGERLFRNLARLPMVRRDLSWSEFLRKHRGSGNAVERLVEFFERGQSRRLSRERARNAIAVLATFLTTTDRALRDRATKAIVLVGESQPIALFEFAESCLPLVDDVYVRERVLAAAYAVAMSRYAFAGQEFKNALSHFARWVVLQFFLPAGDLRTQHALVRDYALGLVDLARLVDPASIPRNQTRYLRPPFMGIASPFPLPNTIRSSVAERTKHAIHMDFGNYTIGRLVEDRDNYDANHPVYRRVMKQIQWRILELGYDESVFEKVDSNIAQGEYFRGRGDAGKVERYGKKYGWIAYFEMYGLRQANRQIDDYDERCSDCDIDPTFPTCSVFTDGDFDVGSVLASRRTESMTHWLRNGPAPNFDHVLCRPNVGGEAGPWLLVEARIGEKDQASQRALWTRISCLGLRERDIDRFETAFLRDSSPSQNLPETGGDELVFAGEAGWSARFGRRARSSSGRLRPNRTVVYGQDTRIAAREALKRAWHHFDFSYVAKLSRARSTEGKRRAANSLIEHLEEINRRVGSDQRLRFYEVTRPSARNDCVRGYKDGFRWRTLGGTQIETFGWRYSWESNEASDVSYFKLLSPWVVEALGLRYSHRSTDAIDSNGRKASIYIPGGSLTEGGVELLYCRRDLIETYAKSSGRKLIWVAWGERDLHHSVSDSIRHDPNVTEIVQSRANLHRRIVREVAYGEERNSPPPPVPYLVSTARD